MAILTKSNLSSVFSSTPPPGERGGRLHLNAAWPRLVRHLAVIAILAVAMIPRLLAQGVETYSFTTNRVIFDGDPAGLADVREVSSAISSISSLKVRLKVSGQFNGDLYAYLRHVNESVTNFVVLLNRPGRTASNPFGYSDGGVDVTFTADAPNGDIHLYDNILQLPPNSVATGIWQPDGRAVDPAVVTDASLRTTSLADFYGAPASGEWTLFVADMDFGATHALESWELEISGGAAPVINWPNPADIVYGTPLGASQLNASATVASTNVVGAFTYDPAPGAYLNAGAGQTLRVTFTPNDPDAYATVSTNVTINVAKALLYVDATAAGKVYGDADPALNYTVTGLQAGDQSSAVLSGAPIRAAGENVGSYAIAQGSLAANANYDIDFAVASFAITPAPLSVAANAQSKVYGSADPVLNFAATGFRNGDTAAGVLSGALVRVAGENVGNRAIAQGSLTANANYTVNFTPANLAITPAPLNVIADTRSKVYGSADPALTFSVNGLKLGDTSGNVLSGALSRTAGENVGSYAIARGSLGANANYTLSYTGASLAITPAALNITADAQSKIYGSADPALTYAVTGLQLGDTAGVVSGAMSREPGESVGAYAIGRGSLSAGANYTVNFAGANLTVTPATLNVVADAKSKVYGQVDPVLTYTVTGFTGSDSAGLVTGALGRLPGENVGGYAINSGNLSAGGNYTLSFTGANLVISPAATTGALAVSANPATPGSQVTFTMTLSVVAPGQGTPTGTVNFKVDGNLAGSGTLAGGAATFSSASLTLGSHTVTAEYAGDGNFTGSSASLGQSLVINTPPVANADSIERGAGAGFKVLLSNLLANDSDADGDTLSITVASTSDRGATISVSGDWVFYQPAAGSTNADAFTYTITDGRGGSATGTVNVTIATAREPGANLVLTVLSGGNIRIDGSGIPNRTYRAQFTGSLGTGNWQDLADGVRTADENGAFQVIDSGATGMRFYRTVSE